MTQERLRELLHERVADETMPDCSGRAWQAARVVRRRRRLGAAAGVVAVTVGVSGGIAALDSAPPAPPTDHGIADLGTPPPSPDATARTRPVWFSPTSADEQQLPVADQDVLPAAVHLAADAPALSEDPIPRASAAFAVFDESRLDRVVVLGADGYRSVDVSGVGMVAKSNGYRLWPVGADMLSPDGTHLLFPQDGSVEVLTLSDASWTSVPVELGSYGAHWLDAGTFFVPDFSEGCGVHDGGATYDTTGRRVRRGSDVVAPASPVAGQAQCHGPWVASPDGSRIAQAYGMGSNVPVRDSGTDMSLPETVWVADSGASGGGELLSMTSPVGGDRSKDCCPVAGWLDDDTLVYESRQLAPVLVAWTVGTDDFRLVSRIGGLDGVHESFVASYAL